MTCCPFCKKKVNFKLAMDLVEHIRHKHTDYEIMVKSMSKFRREKEHREFKMYYRKKALEMLKEKCGDIWWKEK